MAMVASRPSSPAPTPPRFAGLALALLLPVGLLAVLAIVALTRDWRATRAEAAARGQELALALAERCAAHLASPETAAPETEVLVLDDAHRLVHPRAADWPPTPDPLNDDDLPASARSALAARDWNAALPALTTLLAAPVSPATNDTVRTSIARQLARALLEASTEAERQGRFEEAAAHLERLLAEPALGRAATEAGVPAAHLAALRRLELASAHPELTARGDAAWAAFAPLLEDLPSTPFLDAVTGKLRKQLAAAPGAQPGATAALAQLDRLNRLRAFHAAARDTFGTARPWPDSFWIPTEAGPTLALRRMPTAPATNTATGPALANREIRFALVPETQFRALGETLAHELDRRGDFALRLSVAGRTLTFPPHPGAAGDASGPDLATANRPLPGGVPLTVAAGLADPTAYFAAQRRRLLIFSGLLAGGLLATGLAVQVTRRFLVRQHELNRQKTNFVSSVSHELRAPLGSIRLLAESLERGTVATPERQLEYFQLISQETRRLGALVENVLDFSRIEQGRKRYDFEPTDVAALVAGTVRIFQPLADARGVELACRVPPDSGTCEIVADGRALQQAQLNLLDNALKHSPAGSRITVDLIGSPDGLRLAVADQGPGIPTEDHDRIFEPFYRRGSELRRETQGVGIGLAIVRHIIDAHHGRVEVRSAPGAGACFTLVLPAAPPASPALSTS